MIIFAVDDEQKALRVLCRAISAVQPDAELYSFQSSTDALNAAGEHPPDVAFLDLRMPVMSGMALAKRLKKLYPKVNIIFATSYSDSAIEALKIHSSGYLMKPITKSNVEAELKNLRNPVVQRKNPGRLYAQTFGYFELFCDGKPVEFHKGKSKELLAFLIDCQGASVNRKQIAASIFEDGAYTRSTQTYLSQIIQDLDRTLTELGIGDLLIKGSNSYAIDTKLITCDAYDYLNGDLNALNAFHGEYMLPYSWGEYRIERFYEG